MKLLALIFAVVLFIFVFVWPGPRICMNVDAAFVAANKRHIQACKDMGGHPLLFWHQGYGDWILDSCKL